MFSRLSGKMPIPRRPTATTSRDVGHAGVGETPLEGIHNSEAPSTTNQPTKSSPLSKHVSLERDGRPQGIAPGHDEAAPTIPAPAGSPDRGRPQGIAPTIPEVSPGHDEAVPTGPSTADSPSVGSPFVGSPPLRGPGEEAQSASPTQENGEPLITWTAADLAAYRVQLLVPIQNGPSSAPGSPSGSLPPISSPSVGTSSAGLPSVGSPPQEGSPADPAQENPPQSSSDTGPYRLAYLANLPDQLRDIYELEQPTPTGSYPAQRKQRSRQRFIIISTIVVLLALLGSIAAWAFQINRTDQAALTQRMDAVSSSDAAQVHCVPGGSANMHDLACWSVKADLTFSGAASGHVTTTASCVLFLDVDNDGKPDQHIDCDTENNFTLATKQYHFSWFIHHYVNPGNYGSNGEVNASLPQIQSQPFLLWNSNSNLKENTAVVGSDKMSGIFSVRLIQSNTDAGITPSAVTVTGSWIAVTNTCKNAHALHFCG